MDTNRGNFFEGSFMTDDFLTVVFMSSFVIAILIFLFKGKEESKTFLSTIVVIIVALFLITLMLIGIKSIF
ncbi:hypothetical protein [Flavobacterium sp. 5]|uniref:hypothetical protein n=1 Tax=Flavobacterium sp. 5 TaxID=2035199 RepID=UPI000C2C1A98|nr:hypothetical protein [Flavobacterium sp. 5]PKB14989.1 hypothetical protein CLU82_0036 [Flavobacterium sp. 5]